MNCFERHPRLTSAIVLAILFAIGVVSFELILRFTPLGAYLIHDPRPLVPARHVVLREFSPDLTVRFAPPEIRRSSGDLVAPLYAIETDRDGFIQPGRHHSDPDITIAFLGGSTTECLFVDPENRFPVVVGRELERRLGIKVNVLNGARSGNNTQHLQTILQNKLLPLRPDFVVMMENANDIGVLSQYGTYWNNSIDFELVRNDARGIVAGIRLIRDDLFGYSYRIVREVGRMLTDRVFGLVAAQARSGASRRDVEDWARDYEASLTQFIYTAQAWGIRPILMTQVLQGSVERDRSAAEGNYLADALLQRRGFSAESFDSVHSYFNEIARYVAGRHGAGLIDLSVAGNWSHAMLYDGLHFSDPGSLRVADIIVPALEDEIRRKASLRKP